MAAQLSHENCAAARAVRAQSVDRRFEVGFDAITEDMPGLPFACAACRLILTGGDGVFVDVCEGGHGLTFPLCATCMLGALRPLASERPSPGVRDESSTEATATEAVPGDDARVSPARLPSDGVRADLTRRALEKAAAHSCDTAFGLGDPDATCESQCALDDWCPPCLAQAALREPVPTSTEGGER